MSGLLWAAGRAGTGAGAKTAGFDGAAFGSGFAAARLGAAIGFGIGAGAGLALFGAAVGVAGGRTVGLNGRARAGGVLRATAGAGAGMVAGGSWTDLWATGRTFRAVGGFCLAAAALAAASFLSITRTGASRSPRVPNRSGRSSPTETTT